MDEGTPVHSSSRGAFLTWMAAAFATLWLGMLLHEALHFLVGPLLFPPSAWHRSVSGWRRGLVVGAGPAANLGLLALACVLARYLRTDTTPSPQWRFAMATTLGWGAASRVAVIAPSVLVGTFRGDEFALAQGAGLPLGALLLPELLLSLAGGLWLGYQIPRRARATALGGALTGVILGWFSVFSLGRRLGLPM